MNYNVYILKCSDNSYYTGITNNIEKRVSEHNIGIDPSSYTFNRRPCILVFSQSFSDPLQAIEAEKQLKGWKRKKKEALINGNFDLLHELAQCVNYTNYSNK